MGDDAPAKSSDTAIGILTTRGNINATVGAVRAAIDTGHAVFVVVPDFLDDVVSRVQSKHVTVLRYRPDSEDSTPEQVLAAAGREHEYSGVVYQRYPEFSLDVDASYRRLDSSAAYVVDGVPSFGETPGGYSSRFLPTTNSNESRLSSNSHCSM